MAQSGLLYKFFICKLILESASIVNMSVSFDCSIIVFGVLRGCLDLRAFLCLLLNSYVFTIIFIDENSENSSNKKTLKFKKLRSSTGMTTSKKDSEDRLSGCINYSETIKRRMLDHDCLTEKGGLIMDKFR